MREASSEPVTWRGQDERPGAHALGATAHRRRIGATAAPVANPTWADRLIDQIAPCPWPASTGASMPHVAPRDDVSARTPLYTPEERARRDKTVWTLVQGVLAPVQFLVFLVSLGLIVTYLTTGQGHDAAMISVVIKTLVLYTIMITGSIWEKEVFGKWLFARSFFWEDVFSMLVLALHTAYLVAIVFHIGDAASQMWLALAAYATYVINAAQFLWKLRMARFEGGMEKTPAQSGAQANAQTKAQTKAFGRAA